MIDRFIVRAFTLLAGLVLAAVLAACSTGGGEKLSPTLTAAMDQPGAALNRVDALYLINDFRQTRGAPPLRGDSVLESSAQNLAELYAKSATPPPLPKGIDQMLLSAGYSSFAETFSGWRNDPSNAAILADPTYTRAGIGVSYDRNSPSGVHWVLMFGR